MGLFFYYYFFKPRVIFFSCLLLTIFPDGVPRQFPNKQLERLQPQSEVIERQEPPYPGKGGKETLPAKMTTEKANNNNINNNKEK